MKKSQKLSIILKNLHLISESLYHYQSPPSLTPHFASIIINLKFFSKCQKIKIPLIEQTLKS